MTVALERRPRTRRGVSIAVLVALSCLCGVPAGVATARLVALPWS